MPKTTKKQTRKRKNNPKAEQAPPLNGTWRISRFPDTTNFPPTEKNDGTFVLDIDNTGKLKDTSKHSVGGTDNQLIGKASAKAVRIGHKAAPPLQNYSGVLVHDAGGVMILAGSYVIRNVVADQEQGTWTGTKP